MLIFLVNALKIIFLLGLLVFIHEGGHFLVAKACKIKVNEFALGFGPTLISKTKGETKYAVHLIPLGGYVDLEGEEQDSDEEGSFSKASTPKKIAILLAGGTVNILFGVLIYFGLLVYICENVSFIERLQFAFSNTGGFIASIFTGLKELFTGRVGFDQMTGIVGISNMVVKTSNLINYLYLMGVISLSLGITNLLPFPPLDGGKIVIYIIEAIRRKPLNEKFETNLQMVGFALLIALSIYVTYLDILRI